MLRRSAPSTSVHGLHDSSYMTMLLQAIAWLETELSKSDTSLIMVTHDRWFMETVCTRLVELEQGSAHAHAFGGRGSYDRYRQVGSCSLLVCI